MELMKKILFRFMLVLSCVCVIVPLAFLIVGHYLNDTVLLLWQIAFLSLLCALGDVILYTWGKEISKRRKIIRQVIHYVYINIVVIGVGLWLHFFKLPDLIVMLPVIAVIYWINWITSYQKDKELAKELNQKLKLYQDKE